MAKWDEQLTFEEVKVGDELPELALPLTVQLSCDGGRSESRLCAVAS